MPRSSNYAEGRASIERDDAYNWCHSSGNGRYFSRIVGWYTHPKEGSGAFMDACAIEKVLPEFNIPSELI